MAWSIFTDGGGQGAAVTWAEDLLKALGVPTSSANVKMIYDWELAEGGGGKFNPLNQGPVPGQPSLTSTGQQYGGGAADFVSWQAGIQGAVDYIHMPAYAGVLQGLQQSNYSQATSSLWASSWAASHYGYGSAWPGTAPGAASPLGSGGGGVTPGAGTGGDVTTAGFNPLGWIIKPAESEFNWFGGLIRGVTGVSSTIGDVGTAITGLVRGLTKITDLFLMLFRPEFWLRVGAFLFGMIALGAGLYFFKESLSE